MESRDFKRSKNKMFKLLATHLAIGVGTGWGILTIFFILDVASLRTLTTANHLEYIVYPLLYIFFAITFGSAAMGIGVMSVKKDDDDDDFGGGKSSRVLDNFDFGNYGQLASIKIPVKK